MNATLRAGALQPAQAAAPGRLDFLGGVADYSGSLVLQMPTKLQTSITLMPESSRQARFASEGFGLAAADLAPLRELLARGAESPEFRTHLDEIQFPRWARYPMGCLIMLARQTGWFPASGFFLQIHSAVPDGLGVSSSAALEVATLRALNQSGSLGLSNIELGRLGQQAENFIVGASCGLMDQLASSCGRPGELLPILCRPDIVSEPMTLPGGLLIAGWPSGEKHHVGASPYATARAAAFMGKRMVERLSGCSSTYTSEIPVELWRSVESAIPEATTGSGFLKCHEGTDDPLSQIDPEMVYPVRAATRFPIEENARAHRTREILASFDSDRSASAGELREILKASHLGYSAMGLGSNATDAILERLLQEPPESGLIGGRISGGGSGGTVVVLLEEFARDKLVSLATTSPFKGDIIF